MIGCCERRIVQLAGYLNLLKGQIHEYMNEVLCEHFGFSRNIYSKIERVIVADYNINFVIQLDRNRYLLRVNVEQQSGLPNQIEYEYQALKFLSGLKIAPQPYLVDNSKNRLRFGFLVEEYLIGEYLDYDELSGILDAAALLAALHRTSLPLDNFFIVWSDPLEENLKDVSELLKHYGTRKTREKKIVSLSSKLIRELEKSIASYSKGFESKSIVHTDVVNDNFIRSPQGLRLIDWEKPRVDDASYDLCVFLGTPSELWSSPRAMTDEERNLFLLEYCRRMGTDLSDTKEKVRIRQPYVSLHWILWAASRLSDVKEGNISSELIQFHSSSVPRYKKVTALKHLEALLREVC
jgi:thiamine kinase-like enzyme